MRWTERLSAPIGLVVAFGFATLGAISFSCVGVVGVRHNVSLATAIAFVVRDGLGLLGLYVFDRCAAETLLDVGLIDRGNGWTIRMALSLLAVVALNIVAIFGLFMIVIAIDRH